MGRNVSDVSKLVKEQQADVSLQKLLVLGKNSEKGYEFVEGILVQNSEDSLGDIQQRGSTRRQKTADFGFSP